MTNLETRQFHKIFEQIHNYEKIVIIGYPKSGKSTLARKLKEDKDILFHYQFIHTDDYIGKFEYKQQLYEIIKDLKMTDKRWIVEGIQGYRLLRKIEELNLEDIRPDLIIACETDRPMDPKHESQSKGLLKIFDDYIAMAKELPICIVYKN